MSTSLEMSRRHRFPGSWGRSRYRRFAALNDSLIMFFHLYEHQGKWFSSVDVCDLMEWNHNATCYKRIRRICESLERIGRIQIQRGYGGNSHNMYRVPLQR